MILKDLVCEKDTIKILGGMDKEVSGVSLDSRSIKEGFIFTAITGENTDGHQFIDKAIGNGARAVVCERLPGHIKEDITYIQVSDSSLVLSGIAASFYGDPSNDLYLVGVTGTNGKTTLTYLLESIWMRQNFRTGLIGTIENRYCGVKDSSVMTTPDAIELAKILHDMREAGVENVSMEVSSHSIDRKRVYGCNFDCAVFTNITQDHLDYHGTFENYYEAKKKFFTEVLKNSHKRSKTAVINMDDSYGKKIYREIGTDKLGYSATNPASDIYASDIRYLEEGITAFVHTPWGKIQLNSGLIGKHNLYNLLAAIAVSVNQIQDTDKVQSSLSGKIVIPGRLEKIESNTGLNVFVDYAHTPDALENILNTVRPLTNGKLITVFGCGGDRDRSKRPEMGRIAYELSDIAIVTSDNPRTESPGEIIKDIEKGIRKTDDKSCIVIRDRGEAIEKAIEISTPEDFVIIAGKGHEDYQVIGTEKQHFDDRETARKYIKEKEKYKV